MSKIIGYKWLTDDMKSVHGNEIWEMDIWKEWSRNLELCTSGFHACRTPLQSLKYIYGNRWFVVEADGEFLEEYNDKFCCSKMRLIYELPVKRILLKFAIACAKNSLFRFEQKYPNDDRPRKAIEIAIDILEGRLSRFAAESAARSAARAAAESVARSAAESAELVARSARSAELVARSAMPAESAAESAARSAESAARSAAELARAAAESAARSAAKAAAESAAWSAARAAAESAARSAAESAEIKWQEKKLQRIIKKITKNYI